MVRIPSKCPPGSYQVRPGAPTASGASYVSAGVDASVALGETLVLPLALGSRGETVEEIIVTGSRFA